MADLDSLITNIANSDRGRMQARSDVTRVPPVEPMDEDKIRRTVEALAADGFDAKTIDAVKLNDASQSMSLLDFSLAAGRISSNREIAAHEAVQKIYADTLAEGLPLPPEAEAALLNVLSRWNVAGDLAESRKWWNRMRRHAAQSNAIMVTEAASNLELGLSLLDWATWINKQTKLLFIPGNQKTEVKQRVLPKIKLDGKEHDIATTAAMNIVKKKIAGSGEVLLGDLMGISSTVAFNPGYKLGALFANRPVVVPDGLAKKLSESGVGKLREVHDQVPALIAAMGPHLTWTEVVERNVWEGPEEGDSFYKDLHDLGNYGIMEMWGLATADAFAEIWIDPFMWMGKYPSKFNPFVVENIAKHLPETHARITSTIARYTNTLSDAVDAYDAARANYNRVNESVQASIAKTKAATGQGYMTAEDARRLIKAKEVMLNEESWLNTFKDNGPNEMILRRTARRNPTEVPNPKATEVYFETVGITSDVIDTTSPTKGNLVQRLVDYSTMEHPELSVRDARDIVDEVIDLHIERFLQMKREEGAFVDLAQEDMVHWYRNNFPERDLFDDVQDTLAHHHGIFIKPIEGRYLGGKRLQINIGDITKLQEVPVSVTFKGNEVDLTGIAITGGAKAVAKNVRTFIKEAAQAAKSPEEFVDALAKKNINISIGEVLNDQGNFDPTLIDKLPLKITGGTVGGKRTKVSFLEDLKSREVTKPITQIAREMDKIRRKELQQNAADIIEWDKVDDLPLFQQRALLGPDDAEAAGDGLSHFIRTGGLGIDDVVRYPLTPEYGGLPATSKFGIDWRAVDEANNAVAAERKWIEGIGNRQYTTEESANRMLLRQKGIANQNLGHARAAGDKAKIALFKKDVDNINAALKTQKLGEGFDAKWLPPKNKGIMEDPEKFNNWILKAPERVAASFYPGGLVLNTAWMLDSPVVQGISLFHTPPRFFDKFMPGSWERIRGGILRYNQEAEAWQELIQHAAERAGLMKERADWNPAKEFSRFVIDKKRNELAFDLLNTDPATPEWEALAAQADEKIIKFHNFVRQILDHEANLQGIPEEGPARKLTGYIHHVFNAKVFAGGARPLEFIGLPREAEVFAAHLLPRHGAAGYPRDALLALDVYGRASARKRIMEPVYDDIIRTGAEIARKHKFPAAQTYANDFVSDLQGRPSFWGSKLDQAIGPVLNKMGLKNWVPSAIDRSLMGMSGMFWAGAIAGNPAYPTMQMANAVATTSSRYGQMRTARALLEMATPEGQAVARAIGAYKSFENVFESDAFRKISNALTNRFYTVGPLGVQSVASTEFSARGMTSLAALDANLTKLGFSTLEEAMVAGWGRRVAFEALRGAEEVNHMFGAMGRSPWASRFIPRSWATTSTQFLGFFPRQVEELLGQTARNPGRIFEYLAVSGWLSRLAAEHQGIDMTDYVGLGFLPTETGDITSPAVDAWLSSVELLSAMSRRDPLETEKAAKKFINNLSLMLPMYAAWNKYSTAWERAKTGESRSADEEKIRNLTFKGEPLSKVMDVSDKNMPGIGGDVFPVIGAQRGLRDRLTSIGQQAMRQEDKKFAYNARVITREALEAYYDQDYDTFDKKVVELQNVAKVRVSGDSRAEQYISMLRIGRTLRILNENKYIGDRQYKIIKDFGLDMEP